MEFLLKPDQGIIRERSKTQFRAINPNGHLLGKGRIPFQDKPLLHRWRHFKGYV